MKYFKQEYINMINSPDAQIRDEGHKLWNNSLHLYTNYFNSIKKKLPFNFIKLYNKFDGFHDSSVGSIQIYTTRRYSCNLSISIKLYPDSYTLSYINVESYSICIPQSKNWTDGVMHWNYAEFEKISDKLWSHEILCEDNCKIKIIFHKISIKKQI